MNKSIRGKLTTVAAGLCLAGWGIGAHATTADANLAQDIQKHLDTTRKAAMGSIDQARSVKVPGIEDGGSGGAGSGYRPKSRTSEFRVELPVNPTPNSADPSELENNLFSYAQAVITLCAHNRQELMREMSKQRNKANGLNAVGGVVTLIGGVAAYAPAKVVLMGLGINAGDNTNSVLGGVVKFWGGEATATQEEIENLVNEYQQQLTAYTTQPKENDTKGLIRIGYLLRAQSACAGLTPLKKSGET